MRNRCFICNNQTNLGQNTPIDIFNSNITLQSGKKLQELLTELLDVSVTSDVHSGVLCKKCFTNCSEFDSMQVRLKFVKSECIKNFKTTLTKYKLNYETYNTKANKFATLPSKKLPETKQMLPVNKSPAKQLVLPMSKLQPLPADFVLNLNSTGSKIAQPNKLRPIAPRQMEFNATIGTSVQTHSMITRSTMSKDSGSTIVSSNSNRKEGQHSPCDDVKSTQQALSEQKTLFDVNIHQDYLSRGNISLEIDEDCNITVVPVSANNPPPTENNIYLENEASSESNHTNEVAPPSLGDGESAEKDHEYYILGDRGDEDEQTIVMNGEEGSILRVMAGSKLCFDDDGSLSLVMQDDDDDDKNDEHDSNDESQIELQVSGDEETANAIIAAAQEQGGAFIKVESGEMYRVKSVQSKTDIEEVPVSTDTIDQIYFQVEEEDGQYKCLFCANSNKEVKEQYKGDATFIMNHLKQIHDARIYVCHHCGVVVRKKSDYLAHTKEHLSNVVEFPDKTKSHSCGNCGKTYSSKTQLKEHLNIHTGQRPHTCEVCNKTFASKYTYQNHLRTHTDRPRPYKCTECPKAFLSAHNLSQHIKTHSSIKDFVCNICGKAFGSQHNMEVHAVVHSGTRKFECNTCQKRFIRKNELADHMRTHTGERPYKCESCDARFAQRSNLHSHRRATHLNDRRYHCHLCAKKFKRRRLLDFHIRSAHTGNRNLRCEVCGATFVYPEHYKKHLRIHSGEKPYECEVCGKRFNARDNRNVHRFMHSDKKPYECVVCGAGYMRKQLLLQHMINSSHISESIVVNQPRVAKFGESEFKTEVDAEMPAVATTKNGEKFILQDGKLLPSEINVAPEISLVTNSEDPLINLDPNENDQKSQEITTLDGITADMLTEENRSILAPTEDGSFMRLVPIQLDDGNTGWIALPPE